MKKNFRLMAEQIAPLACGYGGCIATDMITVDGRKVGFMYREASTRPEDSGWRFLSGFESQEYMDDPSNHSVYDINTIANYDPDIIPLIENPKGSAFERNESGGFVPVDFSPGE
jgi:hypothetical protein